MADRTKIEWCTTTWSPITGCTPISEGCQNCYAKRMAQRLKGRYGYPIDDPFRVTVHENRFEQPFGWKKPKKIFVCSMGDLFHNDVHEEDIKELFTIMQNNSQHIYMVLTKRPERMKAVLNWFKYSIPPESICHIWLGVTAENQQQADERIPILLQISAAVRFVSLEPMLSDIWIDYYLPKIGEKQSEFCESRECAGCLNENDLPCEAYTDWINEPTLDWVIVGGETGPGARPMHPDWVRSVRDQCQQTGVSFFFKSWGEYLGGYFALKVGKKKSGRLLDGREWNEYPI